MLDTSYRMVIVLSLKNEIDFISNVIKMSGKKIIEAVLHLIIEENRQNQEELNERGLDTSNESYEKQGSYTKEFYRCGKIFHKEANRSSKKELYNCRKKGNMSKTR